MDEEIVFDENLNNEQEGQVEELLPDEENIATTEQIIFSPENLEFSEPFFMGVSICGVMCMFSLGVHVVLRIFRNW